MNKFLIVAIVISLCQACSTPTPTDSLAEIIKKVETGLTHPVYIERDSTWTIEERMEKYGVPGVSIAVIKDNKIDWVKSYGVMDKDTRTPVTPQTLFQAGSISKPVAAYGALKLAEQNKIALEENINTYLKSWKLPDNEFTQTKKVTLAHLLNHSGGITVHGFLGYSPDLPVPSLIQVLDGLKPANSPAIRVDKIPEKSFRYSGGGYCIAQQAMIDIEGKPFPTIMQDLVLRPLGMIHSTYDQPLPDSQLTKASTGYLPDGTMTKGKRHTYPEMAAAGLWTTAEDLAKFAIDIQQTYHGKRAVVLSQTMARKMLTPFVEEFVGLGIFLDKMKDDLYFGHGGWDEGFSSQMTAHRDKGYGVVILTNSNHPEFIEELVRSVALTYHWDNMVPVYKKLEETPSDIQTISGRYRKGQDELIEVYATGNRLMNKRLGTKPTELIKITDSTYTRRESERPFQFKINPQTNQMELLILQPPLDTVISTFIHMKADEKIPFEYLEANQFDAALQAYQTLMKTDPKNRAVDEGNLNQKGYQLLNSGEGKLAQQVFRLNTILYPLSANTYDSYAEACMKNKDLELAIANYKKTLEMNPDNPNAVKMLAELVKETNK